MVITTPPNTHADRPSGRPAALLLSLTGALLALLILNLVVFDDLRVDPAAGVLETFLKPQHLSSLLAVLIAGALIAFKHRSAARVAIARRMDRDRRVHVLSPRPGPDRGRQAVLG